MGCSARCRWGTSRLLPMPGPGRGQLGPSQSFLRPAPQERRGTAGSLGPAGLSPSPGSKPRGDALEPGSRGRGSRPGSPCEDRARRGRDGFGSRVGRPAMLRASGCPCAGPARLVLERYRNGNRLRQVMPSRHLAFAITCTTAGILGHFRGVGDFVSKHGNFLYCLLRGMGQLMLSFSLVIRLA